jgi:uncharacterized protein YrzB (UPF0473 family)
LSAEGRYWVDEEEGFLIFEDEQGINRFVIDDEFEFEGIKYLLLTPAEQLDEDDEETYLVKMINSEEEEILSIIEDDLEFERVKRAYLEMLE